LQVLIGHLIFLHKAIKPARAFVNCILALLRSMGTAPKAAISEGTKQDLQWFMACAHAANSTIKIYKCVLPRLDIYVDASLSGLGGFLGNYVYELLIFPKPEYCIVHWEAINILVALRTFSQFYSITKSQSGVITQLQLIYCIPAGVWTPSCKASPEICG
jgi:hypothetical protein